MENLIKKLKLPIKIGYFVPNSRNGKTGLEKAIAVEYDLILLDLQISNLDGINLCRQFRFQGYHKPILLLTTKHSNSHANIVARLDAGADACVIKPDTPDELLARIRALLRRSTETNRRKKYQPSAEDIVTANKVLARLRDSFKKRAAEQVAVLEQAHTALLAGHCDDELQQAAQHEAHKLAGSMATFGYPEGSKLGRLIEHLLSNDHALTPEEISLFSQLLTGLHEELTKSPVTSTSSAAPTPQNISPTGDS